MSGFDKLQVRRGNAAQWASTDPVLLEGEPGLETDTRLFKVGDGVLPWSLLGGVASDSLEPESFMDNVFYTKRARSGGLAMTGGFYLYGTPFAEVSSIDASSSYYLTDWKNAEGATTLQHYDQSGWLIATPYTPAYWGVEVPAYTTFDLPPGIYFWSWISYFANAVTYPPDANLEMYMDYGTAPDWSDLNNDQPFITGSANFGNYWPADLAVFPKFQKREGIITIPQEGTTIAPTFIPQITAPMGGLQTVALYILRLRHFNGEA